MKIDHVYIISGIIILLLSINFVAFDNKFYLERDSGVDYYEEEVNNLLDYFMLEKLDEQRYSQREIIHLQDVRSLFILSWITLIVLLSLLTYGHYKSKEKGKFTRNAGLSSIIFLALISLLSLNFSWFFTQFHQVLFRNEYWLLPSSSTLISLFPQSFFMAATLRILLYSLLTSILLLLLSSIWSKNDRKT